MITWDDFDKIWASTSPLTPYSFSDPNYAQGWNFIGSTPPARQMWDSIQKANDEKFKFLRDNFGTPNMVTTAAQMTDTDKIYVYVGSEAGWSNGHWYYYDAGTSTWVDGGVYNSTALVTDTTLTVAGKAADAKAVGDALALKADLAGATFSGNVAVNADFSTTGDATVGGDLTVSGATTLTGNVTANGNISVVGDIDADNITLNGDISATDVTASGDVTANDASFANATLSGTLTVSGATTLDGLTVGSVSAQSLNTTGNASVGGTLTVSGATTLSDITAGDVTADDVTANGNLSVVGNATLNGTSTAVTPAEDDNSTKIATTAYVQTEVKPIETDVTINDKRISNIEKLLQGNLYDYQTDSDSKYVKTVPAGAMPYASLNSIGGKTIVWNQTFVLSMLRSDATSYGVTSERTDNGIRLYGAFTSAVNLPVFNSWYDAIIGHKYLITNTPVSEALTLRLTQNGTYVNWQENTPFTATDTHTYLAIRAITTGVTFDVTWTPQIFDLTLMFGAGNEPTTYAEFQQMFPASYYSYNAGTLLSAGVTEVVSKKADTTTIATYSIPAEIQALEGYGWSARNAYNYVDFERKVFVKNVDRVDLGTLSYSSSSTTGNRYFFSGGLSDVIKYTVGSNSAVNNIVCDKYIAGSFVDTYNGAFNCIGVGGNLVSTGRIGIYDSTKEEMTNAEFKESVSGVYAYYELATPQEIDISAYLTDDNLISVESGGTLTFPNSNGDDYRIDVPSAETYMINLQASLGE